MASATIHREWIDWSRPFPAAAAERVIAFGDKSTSQKVNKSKSHVAARDGVLKRGLVDLSEAICITPGKRGGRVLLEAMLRECEARGLALQPPRIITPGSLPEVVCPPEPQPVATKEESRFAWIAAMQSCDAERVRPLVPRPPARDDLLAWHALAGLIQNLHETLAGGMLSFSDVADRAARLELFGETDRWNALSEIHRAYLSALKDANLLDAHQARLESLTKAQGLQSLGGPIILIGITELNALQRVALQRAHAAGANIIAIIHAPEELSESFDELGCVISEKWQSRAVPLRDEQIVIADQPDDQAQAALESLAHLPGAPIDSITIGLGDEALGDALERAAEWAGVAVHRPEAMTLASTAPFRLLEVMRDWISEQRFAPFAAMLRHPDIERWLDGSPFLEGGGRGVGETNGSGADSAIRDWISLLDNYFTDHLHKRFTGTWLGKRAQSLKRIHDAITTLGSSLLSEPRARPLAQWANPILDIIQQVYTDPSRFTVSPSHRLTVSRDACLAIRNQLAVFTTIDAALQPQCDAATALSLLLASCEGESLSSQPREDEIEALGWLELHLDAAPNTIIMGVNDGAIPAAFTSDQFLPDSLRAALGLPCSASRYARDAYLLEAISRSREELALITGRRGSDYEPLTPSRLLFACEPDDLPGRVLLLSDENRARRYAMPIGAPEPAPASDFTIFSPPPGPCAMDEMHVTSFRTYLQCPFRWWLRMREGLCAVDDGADELDPLSFGGLAHDVLEAFGADESIRESVDADSIAEWLADRLALVTSERFGSHPPPAVRVQLDRLRRRFEAFAHYQARTRADGWRIIESEIKVRGVPLDIPGQEPIRITGKIDRIDEKREGKVARYRIIDYKTSEQPDTPFQTHHNRKTCDPENWVDLQLPLYRLLAAHLGYGDSFKSIETGYIVLPRDLSRIDFLAAKWTESDHEAAIECAREVVRRIRAGEFPMSDDVDAKYDEFINICQTNVRGRAALLAATGEESES